MSNKKTRKSMVYHVIISLSEGIKKLGKILSLLEENGLELCNFDKIQDPTLELTIIGEILFNVKVGELPAMEFYRKNFLPNNLKEEIKRFYGNHIELFFETEGKLFDCNELWKLIVEKVFNGGENVPLMFVTTSTGGNGLDNPFIPKSFELGESRYFPARTPMPHAI